MIYVLLNEDSIHKGESAEEVVNSMRQAMFTPPSTIMEYMLSVKQRVLALGMGTVGLDSHESFIESLVGYGLAKRLSEQQVLDRKEEFAAVVDKKLDWKDWPRRSS